MVIGDTQIKPPYLEIGIHASVGRGTRGEMPSSSSCVARLHNARHGQPCIDYRCKERIKNLASSRGDIGDIR